MWFQLHDIPGRQNYVDSEQTGVPGIYKGRRDEAQSLPRAEKLISTGTTALWRDPQQTTTSHPPPHQKGTC